MTALAGFRHLAGYFDPAEQLALLGELRGVIRIAPLFVPRMPRTGKPFSVRMSNCGTLGWVSDQEAATGIRPRTPKPACPGRPCRAS